MARIDFHPVWDAKVAPDERERLEAFAATKTIKANELTVELYRGKYKKNGAIVTTVLLGNGFADELRLTDVTVKVFTSSGELLAAEEFTPHLTIATGAWQVWSFVFQPASMQIEKRQIETDWRVEIF